MDDRTLGAAILMGSVIGVAIYFYIIFFSPWILIVIQISMFLAVLLVLAILGWIGYTMATTPPPEPLESFTDDEELEEN